MMAFNGANLAWSAVSGHEQYRQRVWDYSTSDNLSVVEGSGYFGGAVKELRPDDLLRVMAGDGNALYLVDGVDASGPTAPVVKLASGVTSFPT